MSGNLTPADIAAVADAVADRMAREPEQRYVDAKGAASYLSVSTDWVYENQGQLGAVRLGEGSRPRLRFDLRKLDEYANACTVGKSSLPDQTAEQSGSKRGRPRRYRATAPGVPVIAPDQGDQRAA